jgi:antitoxin (DNA-binding transcriptional repressor) of toxin-antitoxin stability system
MPRALRIDHADGTLSRAVRIARRSGEVVLTSKGRPVARLVAVRDDAHGVDEALRRLAAGGFAELPERPLRKRMPPPVKPRKPVSASAVLRAMRR